MPLSFWTRKKITVVILSSVAYFGLWGVTARLAVPILREAGRAKYTVIPVVGPALIAFCEASAVAPFVVRVQCKRAQLSRGSIMTVEYVLWPGKWRRKIWRAPAVFIS